MANRTVQLYKYIKLPDLGWRYCKAMFYPNNRLKPHAVMTQDGEQTIKDGYYCLSYNRKWEPVGNDPAEAHRLLMKKRGELLTVANGGSVVQVEPKVAGTLKAAFEAWIQDKEDGGAHKDTVDAKRLVAKEFQASCRVKTLAAVTKQMCVHRLRLCPKGIFPMDSLRFIGSTQTRAEKRRNTVQNRPLLRILRSVRPSPTRQRPLRRRFHTPPR